MADKVTYVKTNRLHGTRDPRKLLRMQKGGYRQSPVLRAVWPMPKYFKRKAGDR